jgi:hypothetical protein
MYRYRPGNKWYILQGDQLEGLRRFIASSPDAGTSTKNVILRLVSASKESGQSSSIKLNLDEISVLEDVEDMNKPELATRLQRMLDLLFGHEPGTIRITATYGQTGIYVRLIIKGTGHGKPVKPGLRYIPAYNNGYADIRLTERLMHDMIKEQDQCYTCQCIKCGKFFITPPPLKASGPWKCRCGSHSFYFFNFRDVPNSIHQILGPIDIA